ncbi:hypothetical protein [Adlercreutzia sp. ZJ154]|uniref:hypothetical protein n=1 Tax=Adlercreutzia sp. ZJ154 TaxID=2709790 RepID=UPI0013EC0E5C|nr:hypothetical protein [Adlercreutzia sp. ZJ154]
MNMTDTNSHQPQMISLIAYEAQAARLSRIIRNIVIGWIATVALFATTFIVLMH